MERMQIYIDSVLHRRLAHLAATLKTSQSRLIREGVQLLLEKKTTKSQDPLLQLSRLSGRSGKSNISEEHDAYLAAKKKAHAS